MPSAVPSISSSAINAVQDPQVRGVLRAIADNFSVRNGDVGSGDDKFLTLADLRGGPTGWTKTAAAITNALAPAMTAAAKTPGSDMQAFANTIVNNLMGTAAWQQMFSAIQLINAPDNVAGSAAYNLLQEAQARTTAITTVQTTVTKTADQLASSVTTLTAQINQNAAAISQAASTAANATSALASLVNTLAATVAGNTAAITQAENTAANATSALASQVNGLSATTAQNTAAINNEANARTGSDNALANAINSIWAQVGNGQALVSSGSNVSVNYTGSTASAFQQLQATVNDPVTGLLASYAALSQQASVTNSAITGLQGQWGVKVDLNGYVTGVSLNSGVNPAGQSQSQFIVLANTFAIGMPGKPGIVPFIVDANTGTLAISGNFIAKGSITGDSLQANSITATNGVIGTAAITTLMIGDNQVTVPASTAGVGPAGAYTGSASYMMTQIAAATINVSYPSMPVNTPVSIVVTWQTNAPQAGGNSRVEVHMDGQVVLAQSDTAPAGLTTSHVASAVVVAPPGNHSFTLWFANDWPGGGTWSLGRWSMTVIGVMR